MKAIKTPVRESLLQEDFVFDNCPAYAIAGIEEALFSKPLFWEECNAEVLGYIMQYRTDHMSFMELEWCTENAPKQSLQILIDSLPDSTVQRCMSRLSVQDMRDIVNRDKGEFI